MKRLLSFFVLLIATQANAGVVYNANTVSSQVAMSRNASGIESCGVRIISAVEIGTQIRWYDFSGMVYRKGLFGLWKAGSYMQETKQAISKPLSPEKSIRYPAPTGFWVATKSSAAPVEMSKVFASGDRGFTLGGADFSETFRIIADIAKGDRAQFSASYKDEKFENIISFASPLSKSDYETLMECFADLHTGLQEDMKTATEK